MEDPGKTYIGYQYTEEEHSAAIGYSSLNRYSGGACVIVKEVKSVASRIVSALEQSWHLIGATTMSLHQHIRLYPAALLPCYREPLDRIE